MRKVIYSFIFILILILGLNSFSFASDVSFDYLERRVQDVSALSLSSVLNESQNSDIKTSFMNDFNSSVTFLICEDWYWTQIPDSTMEDSSYIYFIFPTTKMNNKDMAILTYNFPNWTFEIPASTSNTIYNIIYQLNLHTNTITKIPKFMTNYTLLKYNIVSFPEYSGSNFGTLDVGKYLLSHFSIGGYNYRVRINYQNGSSTASEYITATDMEASPFPWDNPEYLPGGSGGGSESGGSSSSFIPSFSNLPYLITKFNGYVSPDDLTMKVYCSKSGDVNFRDLIFDTYVYTIVSGELELSTRAKFQTSIDTFYNYWTYNDSSGIWSTDYYKDLLDGNDLVLYVKISTSSGTYIGETGLFTSSLGIYNSNASISTTIGGNTVSFEGQGYFSPDNSDIESLFNSTKDLANNIFTFWGIFPPWLTAMITTGIAIVILLRILGR